MTKRNLLITMSGGTTTVVNSTLAGIVEESGRSGSIDRIYAGSPGMLGVLAEELVELTALSEQDLQRLRATPGSGFIGTTRISAMGRAELARFQEVAEAYGIGYFVNIGGNGSIKQSCLISQAMGRERLRVAGVAKTVDNDLGDREFRQVFFTPGFPSCVRYWAYKLQLMNQENLGACSHDRVLIAQTFGRETGFLAGAARVSDPDRKLPLLLLLPEDQRPLEEVLGAIERSLGSRGRALVILAEGYAIGELGARRDPTEQVMYGSSANQGAQLLVNECMRAGFQARAFIPAIDQRIDIASSSSRDQRLAYELGRFVVSRFHEDERHFFASIGRAATGEPELLTIPLESIDDFSRRMPSAWIAPGRFDVTDAYVDYLRAVVGSDRDLGFISPPPKVEGKRLPRWAPK